MGKKIPLYVLNLGLAVYLILSMFWPQVRNPIFDSISGIVILISILRFYYWCMGFPIAELADLPMTLKEISHLRQVKKELERELASKSSLT